jgi:uncharacterized protein (TIGR03437 family)
MKHTEPAAAAGAGRNIRSPIWLFLLAGFSALHAQNAMPGAVVSAGYEVPGPIRVSPGQVLTLFLSTPGAQPAAAAVAQTVPLPTNLGGGSIQLFQTFSDPLAVPLLAVYPVDNCFGLFPLACTNLTAITVEIPHELAPNIPRAGRPTNFAVLRITMNGTTGDGIPLSAVTDAIHVLTTCDSTATPTMEASGPCYPVVRHPDGSLVTSQSPAAAGEILTLFAFGMGQTPNGPATGSPASDAVPLSNVQLSFAFGSNRNPFRPGNRAAESPLVEPLTANRTPGTSPREVGLYQIQFQVPPAPSGTPACIGGTIISNLTINIGRATSFDGAAICVQP